MSRTSNDQYVDGRLVNGFDYIHQAWVINGVYVACGHPEAGEVIPARSDFFFQGGKRHTIEVAASVFDGCNCYGKIHAGEKPPIGQRYDALAPAL